MKLPPLSLTRPSDLIAAVLNKDFAILTGLGATSLVAAVCMLRANKKNKCCE